MLIPYEEGLAFIKTIPGAEAYWVLDDGTIHDNGKAWMPCWSANNPDPTVC
jgi:hypothetical protein